MTLPGRLASRPASEEELAWFGVERPHRAGAVAFSAHGSKESLGVAVYERDESADALFIRTIVIRPELRGWGFGPEAVELLERDNSATSYTAWVQPTDGLNLYFWLRLGYRPVRSRVVDPAGMITMVRTGRNR